VVICARPRAFLARIGDGHLATGGHGHGHCFRDESSDQIPLLGMRTAVRRHIHWLESSGAASSRPARQDGCPPLAYVRHASGQPSAHHAVAFRALPRLAPCGTDRAP
jgi:hypothetical protein